MSQYGLDGAGEWHQSGTGGEEERHLGGDTSCEIVGAKLYMYGRWGRGLYEEAEGFSQQGLAFLK